MPELSRLRPAMFLDRDGTLCEEASYLNQVSRFRMFPFAAEWSAPPDFTTGDLTEAVDWILRQAR